MPSISYTDEVSLQGQSVLGSNILYAAPLNTVVKITLIKYFNPLAYNISLVKYQDAIASSVMLYDLTLAAGDAVTDSNTYILQQNDYIEIIDSVGGTNYLVNLYIANL